MSLSRRVSPAILAVVPVILLIGGTLALATARKWNESKGDDAAAKAAASPLVRSELKKLIAHVNQEDERTAYSVAQTEVRQHLLQQAGDKTDTAQFPRREDILVHGATGMITVTKRAPYLWRVRAPVEWMHGTTRLRRYFEADLRHGPADDHWYLVDTEFLNSQHQP